MNNFKIRPMRPEDLKLVISWAAEEGWNPGIYDSLTFWEADPSGFFLGELSGVPVASYSAVKYDDHFAFHGLYFVKKEYRARGYGLEVWKAGGKSLGGRVVGGDAVTQNVPLYETSDHKPTYHTFRFQGKVTHHPLPNAHLLDCRDVSFSELAQFDRLYFPASREKFLFAWIHQPESVSLACRLKNQLKGYITVRKYYQGYKIGPLFAHSYELASSLLLAALNKIPEGETISIDVPEPNREALRLVSSLNLTKSFETVRIYGGGVAPILPLNEIFGVTSLELG